MEPSPAAVVAAHAARGELAYQLDERLRPQWPPRFGPFAWAVSAGAGTVYATTTVRRRGEEPADVSLVDLDEGFRIMSRVVGGSAAIGTRVRLAWEGDVPVFVAEGAPASLAGDVPAARESDAPSAHAGRSPAARAGDV